VIVLAERIFQRAFTSTPAARLRSPAAGSTHRGGEVLVDAPNQRLRPLSPIPTRVRDGMVEVHVV